MSTTQWRTELKCRPGRRPKMPPLALNFFEFPEIFFITSAKISDDLFFCFSVFFQDKRESSFCAPPILPPPAPRYKCRPPFLPSFSTFITFSYTFSIFSNFFQHSLLLLLFFNPILPPLHKCRPGRLAPPAPPTVRHCYHVLQQGHTSNVSGCARCAYRFTWSTTRSSCFINFLYQMIQRVFILSSVRKLFNHLKRIKSLTSSQNSDENLIIVRQRRHISSLMTTKYGS